MNDLTDAVRRHDLSWNGSSEHQRFVDRKLFVETARRVANLDIDAAETRNYITSREDITPPHDPEAAA